MNVAVRTIRHQNLTEQIRKSFWETTELLKWRVLVQQTGYEWISWLKTSPPSLLTRETAVGSSRLRVIQGVASTYGGAWGKRKKAGRNTLVLRHHPKQRLWAQLTWGFRTEGSRPLYGQVQGSLAEHLARLGLRTAQCRHRVSIMSPRWGIKCPSFRKIWFFKRVWTPSNVLLNFKEGAV